MLAETRKIIDQALGWFKENHQLTPHEPGVFYGFEGPGDEEPPREIRPVHFLVVNNAAIGENGPDEFIRRAANEQDAGRLFVQALERLVPDPFATTAYWRVPPEIREAHDGSFICRARFSVLSDAS